jgi:glycosyltransferase involved in cell wall biosynthesis
MTTYNCEKYLDFSIGSILNQSYHDIEVIVVDDASTDSTMSLLEEYKRSEPRIKVVQMNTNVGTYVCRNVGISMASGHWITFQDADDYSHSTRIEKQIKACLQSKSRVCYVSFVSRKNGKKSLAEISLFIEANLLRQRYGYFHNVRFGADSELRNRIQTSMESYVTIDECLYFCLDKWTEVHESLRGRQESLTNVGKNEIREQYKKYYVIAHSQMPCLRYSFINDPYEMPGLRDNNNFIPQGLHVLKYKII